MRACDFWKKGSGVRLGLVFLSVSFIFMIPAAADLSALEASPNKGILDGWWPWGPSGGDGGSATTTTTTTTTTTPIPTTINTTAAATASRPTDQTSQRTLIGAAVGAAVGGFLVLVLLGVLIFYIAKYCCCWTAPILEVETGRREHSKMDSGSESESESERESSSSDPSEHSSKKCMHRGMQVINVGGIPVDVTNRKFASLLDGSRSQYSGNVKPIAEPRNTVRVREWCDARISEFQTPRFRDDENTMRVTQLAGSHSGLHRVDSHPRDDSWALPRSQSNWSELTDDEQDRLSEWSTPCKANERYGPFLETPDGTNSDSSNGSQRDSPVGAFKLPKFLRAAQCSR